jgi:hypothetical protein
MPSHSQPPDLGPHPPDSAVRRRFYLHSTTGWQHKNLAATLIFVVAAITDWLDGYLARTLQQTSAFGAFLDPVADKLMVAAALIMLVQLDRATPSSPSSSSAAKSPSRHCASGWPRSAPRAAWPCR